jgi:hypothetical protein
MKTRFVRLVAVTALLSLLLGIGDRASAQAGTTFFITEVDSSQFPTVTLRLRAVDFNNRVVSGLSSANLTVFENGTQIPTENVQVTPNDDGPVTFLFLLDHGRLSNYSSFGAQNIRQVFSTLVDTGMFVDGLDQVEVMVRENINTDRTETRLAPTQRGSDLTTWLANYPFEQRRSVNRTKGLEGVADAIAEMEKLVPIPGSQPAVILLVTRYIEEPAASVAVVAAQNQANQALSNYISIYAFQTDPSSYLKEALEMLAEISNGGYAALTRTTAAARAEEVYREINTQRQYYTVTYQSSLGSSGPRTITVNSADVPDQGVAGSYEVSPQPPSIAFLEPSADSVIQREANLDSEGNAVYGPTQVSVVANVSFPDGYPRSVDTGQLLVDGVLRETASPAPGTTQVEFEADLSDISAEGSNEVTLEVRVVDSLGLEASEQRALTVEVLPAPETGGLTSTLALGVLGLVCGGVLVVAAIAGGILYYRRRSAPAAAPAARAAPPEPVQTLLAGRAVVRHVLATLTVLEGPKGLIGEALSITKPTTVIGRNPKTTDINFYAEEESSVSRVHCTIQMDGDVFKITDNGSSAGTRLNGRAIPPDDPVVLADNDEIILGDMGRRGVKLRFNKVSEPDDLKYSGSADDRTRIVTDLGQDDDHYSSYVS